MNCRPFMNGTVELEIWNIVHCITLTTHTFLSFTWPMVRPLSVSFEFPSLVAAPYLTWPHLLRLLQHTPSHSDAFFNSFIEKRTVKLQIDIVSWTTSSSCELNTSFHWMVCYKQINKHRPTLVATPPPLIIMCWRLALSLSLSCFIIGACKRELHNCCPRVADAPQRCALRTIMLEISVKAA